MSTKKFNAHQTIRIDRIKAHQTVLRPRKEKPAFRSTTDYDAESEGYTKQPWEMKHVKNLGAGKAKKNLKLEKIFDTKNDGKSYVKKKETKHDKLSRAFVMYDSKKFHEIDGRYIPAVL